MPEEPSFENVHVHGVAEAVSLKSWQKVVWILLVILSASLMILHFSTLASEWLSEPTATYADTTEKQHRFPSVMVCPIYHRMKHRTVKITFPDNEERVDYGDGTRLPPERRLYNNITGEYEETSAFWREWLRIQPQIGNQSQHWQRKSVMLSENYAHSLEPLNALKGHAYQYSNREEDWDIIKDFYWDFDLGTNMSVAEKKLQQSVEFDVLIREVEGYRLTNKRRLVTGFGVCYAFEIEHDGVENAYLLGRQKSVQFALRRAEKEVNLDLIFEMSGDLVFSDLMFIGEPSFWPQSGVVTVPQFYHKIPDETNEGPLTGNSGMEGRRTMPITRDYNITVYVASVTFSRKNLRRRPCRDWSFDDRSICMVQCFNDEFCSKIRRPCILYHPNQTKEEQFKRLCSFVEGKQIVLDQESDHCLVVQWSWSKYRDKMNATVPSELCEQRCPQLCTESVHYFTHALQESRTYYIPWLNRTHSFEVEYDWYGTAHRVKSTYWANVTLMFQDHSRGFSLIELTVITGYDLIAEFGSSISLWTGASGLAIMQILKLAATRIWRLKK